MDIKFNSIQNDGLEIAVDRKTAIYNVVSRW